MEVFNEFLIIMVTNQFFIFTAFVDDIEAQYNVGGFGYIGFVFVCIFFNGYFVLKNLLNSLKLVLILVYKKCKRRIEKFFKLRKDENENQKSAIEVQ